VTNAKDASLAVRNGAPILIVDDNADDRLLLRYYLEHFHCRIVEAADGAEGLSAALREKPRLIISDALMPGMDGFQFLREVRRSPEIRDVPFVFYSATPGTTTRNLPFPSVPMPSSPNHKTPKNSSGY